MTIPRGLTGYKHGVEALARGLRFAGQIALASMVVTICYDVAMRYVFKAPTLWSLEINTFLVLFVALIPAGDVLVADAQLRITFFIDKTGPQTKWFLEKLTCLLGSLFGALMTWQGYHMTVMAWRYNERMSTSLSTPMVIPYAFIPIGFAVLTLYYVAVLLVGRQAAPAPPSPQEV
jgi:TRAP-type C4-dicarboxylate transport system permease small subunit